MSQINKSQSNSKQSKKPKKPQNPLFGKNKSKKAMVSRLLNRKPDKKIQSFPDDADNSKRRKEIINSKQAKKEKMEKINSKKKEASSKKKQNIIRKNKGRRFSAEGEYESMGYGNKPW